MAISETRAKQVVLLAGLLLLEGKVPPASIAFLAKSYLSLSDVDSANRGLTIKSMSDNYGCTPQSGRKHVFTLVHHDILIRRGHKRWQFNWEQLSKLNDLARVYF